MQIEMRPIGIIHSPFHKKEETPIQPTRSKAAGSVYIYPEFADGLSNIEGFSHIYLFYWFHESVGYNLRVQPFLDDETHGIFATRYPYRPNPLGMSIVRLLSRSENELTIENIDVLDGTPLLDIKPYVPDFDWRTDVKVGWYQTRSKE